MYAASRCGNTTASKRSSSRDSNPPSDVVWSFVMRLREPRLYSRRNNLVVREVSDMERSVSTLSNGGRSSMSPMQAIPSLTIGGLCLAALPGRTPAHRAPGTAGAVSAKLSEWKVELSKAGLPPGPSPSRSRTPGAFRTPSKSKGRDRTADRRHPARRERRADVDPQARDLRGVLPGRPGLAQDARHAHPPGRRRGVLGQSATCAERGPFAGMRRLLRRGRRCSRSR